MKTDTMECRPYAGTYIGARTPSVDAVEKVCGETQFTDDLRLPGLLWGAVLTSPHAHARIVSINTAKAEALPGVHAVITHQDSPRQLFNRIMRWARDDLPATERVLDDVVRHVGDEVAAVAAETEAIARQAAKLIEVAYEILPAVFDPERALEDSAPAIYPEGNLLKEQLAQCGSVDDAFAEASVLVENTLSTPMIHHGAIEPHMSIARWSRTGELDVWEPQQGPHRVQLMLGRIFNIPYSKIHVHSLSIGGTFGGKDGILLQPIALLLSKKAGGRPVKIRYDRTQSMVSTYTRHATKLYGKMAVSPGGAITGFALDSFMNAGPYCGGTINVQAAMCGKMFKIYDVPNMRFHGRAVYTNTPVGGAMRGFGSPKVFTALELLVNKAARAAGMDPAEIRMKNLIEPFGTDPAAQLGLGSARVKQCLQQGVERFRWQERRAQKAAMDDSRYAYGHGVATSMHGNGVAPFAPDITVAELMLHEDGSLLLRSALTDHGAGTYTLEKQIVAEVLDVPLERVMLVHSDTDSCPYDMGAGASRNTWSGGAAVETVARKLKNTIQAVAGEMLDVPAEAIVLEKGGCRAAAGGPSVSLADVACHAYAVRTEKLIELVSYCSDTNAGSYGAHFAAVRVDRQTGEVKVLDYLAVCDVGTPLNPLLLEGQLEGAILMGMGMALHEGLELDDSGKPVNANLKKYRLPRASDMPAIAVHFVDNFEEGGPFGGKSVGESSIVPVAPAIIGAVNDALGADLSVLPLTPQRVREALGDDCLGA